MIYSEYAQFCLSIGYKVLETSNSVWIGPKYGFFSRMPLYETAPPQGPELEALFHQHHLLGLTFAAEAGCKGKISHNYFVRDHNYSLNNLSSNCRRNVRKGLNRCQIRLMSFDELYSHGMPLNLDTLSRQGRSDQVFSNDHHWKRLCQAGKELEQIEVWGAFVQNELGSYIITSQLGPVVSVLFSHSRTDLLAAHPSPALYFTMIQSLLQRPGVEAVYNGAEWLTTSMGLDRFKQGMGFIAEPVVLVTHLRPLTNRILLSKGMRRTISSLGPLFLSQNFHQRIEAVLEMAHLSS